MAIADAVDLPIVLYNIPGRCGVGMSPQTWRACLSIRTSSAIKEPAAASIKAAEIRSLCEIPILSGDDSLTLSLMSIGARGVISVASNLVPAQIKQLVQLAAEAISPVPRRFIIDFSL